MLNYLPGSNPGSGSGVVIGGPRTTASVGGIAPLTSATQGTTWLNDWTLIALNGYGEIVKTGPAQSRGRRLAEQHDGRLAARSDERLDGSQ